MPAIVAAIVTCLLTPLLTTSTPAVADTTSHDVIANLFMWPWTSVATECRDTLGPAGYGAVQVSPPQESISVTGHPWWEVYQPVSYTLGSRMGTRAQFAAMVTACHTAGVKVYADAVINHMAGANQSSSTGYNGASFNTSTYTYSTAGYTASSFHTYPTNCPSSDNQISDWNNTTQVQECELLHLSDLYTEQDAVRTKIAGYLNDLTGLGVDGFRVDAAKHIAQADMAAIRAKLTGSPYIFQEVMPGSSTTALQPAAFESNGSVIEFTYAYDLKSQFTGDIANLSSFGSSWGLEPSATSVVMVSNHDTERNGSTLNYTYGATDTLANVFMLAWGYGTPSVMSSYTFSNTDASPPADSSGYVSAPVCGTGWQCQHRQRAILNMVGWHNAASTASVAHWTSPAANVVAFGRGANAWVVLNNSSSTQSARSYTTGLAAGTYCDIIHGDYSASSDTCSGPEIVVDSAGAATVTVASKDAVAIDVDAKIGSGTSTPTTTATSTSTATPTSTATATSTATSTSTSTSATTVPVSFTVTGAPTSAPIYLVGSVAALGSWAPASAVPLTQSSSGWSASVDLPVSTAIQYKFIAKDSNGNVTWESGSNHTLTTPASGATSVSTAWNGSTSTYAVTFGATATTWSGQNVYVVGSSAALGAWDTSKAVALSSATYPVWKATVALPVSTAVEYKYLKKNPDGTIEWESGANRTLTTGSSGSTTLADTWRGTASTVATVGFDVNATTVYGQNVYVVGSIAALGGWNAASAVALSSSAYPHWTGSVTLPTGQYFEYKYIKKDSAGTVVWESGTNRYYTTGTSAVTLSDTWH